jgi:two-component system chemotaxis response regulator CheB
MVIMHDTKVLIIDDSLMMRTIMNDIVQKEEKCIVIGLAENGKIGLEIAKDKKPDIILLDIEMPIMNGIEFLKRIKLISKAKVIVVSYMIKDNLVKTTMLETLGAAKVISKPSGSLSLNLEEENGSEILTTIRSLIT